MNVLNLLLALLVGWTAVVGAMHVDVFDNEYTFPHATAKPLHNFAFDMFRNIAADLEADENMAFSPLSVYSVLTLLLPGLNGTTFAQVKKALRNDDVNDLFTEESGLCHDVFKKSEYYTLVQANRIFVDKHFQLYKSYKTPIERNHRTPVKKLNFLNKPKHCRSKINRYISKETRHKINDLIPEGAVTSRTRMVLVNSMYMKAQWDITFDPSRTRLLDFQVNPTETIEVQMMNKPRMMCNVMQSVELEAQMVVLPFQNKALSMVIFMPDNAGDFSRFVQANSSDMIKRAMQVLWFEGFPFLSNCDVSMPKFSIEYAVEDLKKTLSKMGIKNLFIEGRADFSKMSPEKGLFVSDTRHKTFIEVDEQGVEAASASTLGIGFRMVPQEVWLNKPFMFLIRHEETGAVLFVGKVVKPQVAE